MDNRSLILNCALELFSARGYDAVGVQEIADSASVTKPTLYHYFGSKLGLLKSLTKTYHEPFIQALNEAAVLTGDLPLTLERVANTFIRFAMENPVYYRLQLAFYFAPQESESWQVVSGWNDQQQMILEELFRLAGNYHGNMLGRHRLFAATFNGMMNTCISFWLNGFTELDDNLVQNILHQFQHGIYS